MSNTVDDTAFECTVWNMIKKKISECFSEIGLPYE